MHHAFLDEYRDVKSPIRRLPIETRLVLLLLYILAVVLTPIHLFWFFIGYAVLIVAAVIISRLPWPFVFRRLKEISPFILLISFSLPFMYKEQRLIVFSRCLVRAVLAAMAMVIILSTAKFTEVLKGLEHFKVPGVFIKVLSFMYRYLFVLEDEFERMQRGLIARTTTKSTWFKIKSYANMLGVLFIRAFERSERIYLAMQARGLNDAESH